MTHAPITVTVTLSLHDALPIYLGYARDFPPLVARIAKKIRERGVKVIANAGGVNPVACAKEVLKLAPGLKVAVVLGRSEEHTSELQSRRDLVCRLLLEKKKEQ